jgi:hypothetical protein
MVPMVELGDMPGVGPVLRRAIWSNNGVWQPGSTVTVRGEWDDDHPGETFVSSKDVVEQAVVAGAAEAESSASPETQPPTRRRRKRGQ